MSYSIALDGPAGAGKSTIAKMVSEKKGCFYVDTGAIYRAMALFMLRNGITAEQTGRIAEKCREADVRVTYENGEQQVFLNGENVNGKIRTEEIGKMASASAAVPAVREWLIGLQRDLAKTHDVIMDGRDIGTCVLPDATVKIYLTASVDVRAKRRYDEYIAKGIACTLEGIRQDVAARDAQDMNRKTAPLKQAEDAVVVDSSDMTIEEVVERIQEICAQKGC
ncbi:MAG: (d)CMP kinase [Firmicutes bacterium]|nr:(d)CMP kinase [Bacillota bacterium]